MAKFHGTIGYEEAEEIRQGVFKPKVIEREAFGDILRNYRRLDGGLGTNDDVNLSSQFSIVADPYAMEHYFAIRYVKWNGGCWKVTCVDVQWPRLILTVGGLYNGETPGA